MYEFCLACLIVSVQLDFAFTQRWWYVPVPSYANQNRHDTPYKVAGWAASPTTEPPLGPNDRINTTDVPEEIEARPDKTRAQRRQILRRMNPGKTNQQIDAQLVRDDKARARMAAKQTEPVVLLPDPVTPPTKPPPVKPRRQRNRRPRKMKPKPSLVTKPTKPPGKRLKKTNSNTQIPRPPPTRPSRPVRKQGNRPPQPNNFRGSSTRFQPRQNPRQRHRVVSRRRPGPRPRPRPTTTTTEPPPPTEPRPTTLPPTYPTDYPTPAYQYNEPVANNPPPRRRMSPWRQQPLRQQYRRQPMRQQYRQPIRQQYRQPIRQQYRQQPIRYQQRTTPMPTPRPTLAGSEIDHILSIFGR